MKEIKNVEDILNDGYAYGNQLDWLFLAMARAAGFHAEPILVASRTQSFFNHDFLDWRQLDGAAVVVQARSKELYLDPATHGCPFGLLPWAKSAVKGMRFTKDGGTFITTPDPASSDAVVERKAIIHIGTDGTLSADLDVAFLGQEALRERSNELLEDEAGRKEAVEKEIKAWLPAGAAFKVSRVSGWDSSDEPIRVEGVVNFLGYATTAGRRLLLPLSLLPSKLPQSFQHAVRLHPIYFHYPSEIRDDLTFQLSPGLHVESLPPDVAAPSLGTDYEFSVRQQGDEVHTHRLVVIKAVEFPVDSYQSIQRFCNEMRTGDEQQAVLHFTQTAQPN